MQKLNCSIRVGHSNDIDNIYEVKQILWLKDTAPNYNYVENKYDPQWTPHVMRYINFYFKIREYCTTFAHSPQMSQDIKHSPWKITQQNLKQSYCQKINDLSLQDCVKNKKISAKELSNKFMNFIGAIISNYDYEIIEHATKIFESKQNSGGMHIISIIKHITTVMYELSKEILQYDYYNDAKYQCPKSHAQEFKAWRYEWRKNFYKLECVRANLINSLQKLTYVIDKSNKSVNNEAVADYVVTDDALHKDCLEQIIQALNKEFPEFMALDSIMGSESKEKINIGLKKDFVLIIGHTSQLLYEKIIKNAAKEADSKIGQANNTHNEIWVNPAEIKKEIGQDQAEGYIPQVDTGIQIVSTETQDVAGDCEAT